MYMRTAGRYALDKLFLFMLFVSVAVIGVGYVAEVDPSVLHAIEGIDFAIIGGYYFFFFTGIYKSSNKLQYCKKHIFLIILLLLPFIPLARALKLPLFEKFFKVGADTAWHLLDEIGLL